jgi:DNA-binding PadR family transcriptional regulator
MSPLVRLPLTIELALLGFLREGALHGYEIHRRLADPLGLGQVWRLKQSHLYALLARLEVEGFLSATLKPQDTRPTRKIYRLTKIGADTFVEWVQSPVPHGRDARLDFLTKLYFARLEGPKTAARLIKRQRAACRAWIAAQQERLQALPDPGSYDWLVCQFRIGQIQAMLEWLDVCEQPRAIARLAA